jgi:hypothetical protein
MQEPLTRQGRHHSTDDSEDKRRYFSKKECNNVFKDKNETDQNKNDDFR